MQDVLSNLEDPVAEAGKEVEGKRGGGGGGRVVGCGVDRRIVGGIGFGIYIFKCKYSLYRENGKYTYVGLKINDFMFFGLNDKLEICGFKS